MDDKHAYYASEAAYGSEKHHKFLESQGYRLDPTLSTYNVKTYAKNGKALVAYRGTNPTNISDLQADKDIVLNRYNNSQFNLAKIIAKRAKKKYGDLVVTGHSLGGTKAIKAADAVGGRAIVFNPGTGLAPLKTGSHKVYRKDKDVISQRVVGRNVYVSSGGHSLSGFGDLFK